MANKRNEAKQEKKDVTPGTTPPEKTVQPIKDSKQEKKVPAKAPQEDVKKKKSSEKKKVNF